MDEFTKVLEHLQEKIIKSTSDGAAALDMQNDLAKLQLLYQKLKEEKEGK